MKRALLDTSMLMYCMQEHVDPYAASLKVEGVSEVNVPLCVIRELSIISRYRGRRGRLAAAALKYVDMVAGKRVRIIGCEAEESVDNALLALAAKCGYVLLTADAELKRRARRMGVEAYSPVSSKAGKALA